MKTNFIGGIKFEMKGVNQERSFNALIQCCEIYNLKRTSHTNAQFCVEYKNYKKMQKKLKNLNFDIINQKKYGILSVFFSFFKKWGIIFASGCFVLGVIILSNFVFSTQFFGLEKIEKNQVISILKQNNLDGFVLKDKINTTQIESMIKDSFDNISMVSAMIKGNTLVISIKEKVINEEYENKDEFQPLCSKYSGLVKEIKLIQGTLKVKVGDIVQVGDVLVEPYIYDSSNQKRSVEPKAEITARVWYVGRENHSSVRVESVRTGKTKKVSYLTFLNLFLSTPPNINDIFSSYESKSTVVCISKFNIVPIYRHETVYYETQKVEIQESFESVKENILQKAQTKTLNLVEEYDIITKEYFNITTASNITFVEYVIEVNKRIDIM